MYDTVRIHDRVRLTRAMPTLCLQCGETGVVQSVWRSIPKYVEVEFNRIGETFPLRVLVRAEHLEVVEHHQPADYPMTGATL